MYLLRKRTSWAGLGETRSGPARYFWPQFNVSWEIIHYRYFPSL